MKYEEYVSDTFSWTDCDDDVIWTSQTVSQLYFVFKTANTSAILLAQQMRFHLHGFCPLTILIRRDMCATDAVQTWHPFPNLLATIGLGNGPEHNTRGTETKHTRKCLQAEQNACWEPVTVATGGSLSGGSCGVSLRRRAEVQSREEKAWWVWRWTQGGTAPLRNTGDLGEQRVENRLSTSLICKWPQAPVKTYSVYCVCSSCSKISPYI